MASRTKKLPKGAVAVTGSTEGLPILGNLVTYTLKDEAIPGTRLVRVAGKHGLDVDLLPEKRTGADVFASACRSVESRRRNGVEIEVKVDQVLHNSAEIVYQITRMVRDRQERVIEHPTAMTLAYEKATEDINVVELEDYGELRELEDAIRKHYTANTKNVPSSKVRNFVRDVIRTLGGQNLRRKAGGLYFVPHEFRGHESATTLDGLKGFVEELYGDDGDFYTIPLVGDEGAREMVRKHFVINIREEARATMERAVQRVRAGKGRGVRADFVANLWNERRRLAGALDEFDELVNVERSSVDEDLRDLDNALQELQDLADEPS